MYVCMYASVCVCVSVCIKNKEENKMALVKHTFSLYSLTLTLSASSHIE